MQKIINIKYSYSDKHRNTLITPKNISEEVAIFLDPKIVS